MSSADYLIKLITSEVTTLSFPKVGASGICVRSPGILCNDNYNAIKKAFSYYKLDHSIIDQRCFVRKFSYIDDAPFHVGRFSFVKEASWLRYQNRYLKHATINKSRILMNDFFSNEILNNESQVPIIDRTLLAMVCHRNWPAFDEIYKHLQEWTESSLHEILIRDIPASNGYQFISASFQR